MPIRILENMPVIKRLQEEHIFVMTEPRAQSQDIRELEIAILNIMPNKEDTELQLLRLLSNSPLQVRVTFLRLDSHRYKNTPEEYLSQFYFPFASVAPRYFDGLIITGAPVESMPFERVDYWRELSSILAWSDRHVTSTVHICWAAQAGLYYHYGIEKRALPEKLSGIYEHRTLSREEELTRGFDDRFGAPHSRYTTVDRKDLLRAGLTLLAESDEAGVYLAEDKAKRRVFILGHPEYSRYTLANEYRRDLDKGLSPAVPVGYFPEDDPAREPLFQWKAQANLLFSNWLNYSVYQVTPYQLGQL